MKLYSANLSPFAARPRIAIYAKGLDVEIAHAPGGPGSDEYRAINPVGKVPCLVAKDGTCIPESDAIVEYLEDAYPETSLRPASAEARAKARVLARVADLYVMAPMSKLFGQLDPAKRDEALSAGLIADLDKGLDALETLLSGEQFAAGPDFTTADVQIAPPLFFLPMMGSAFARPDPLAERPKLAAYAAALREHPAVKRAYREMAVSVAHFQKTGEVT